MTDTKAAFEDALLGINLHCHPCEVRWRITDAIRAHVAEKDARIKGLEINAEVSRKIITTLRNGSMEKTARIKELEREQDTLRQRLQDSPRIAIQQTPMGFCMMVTDAAGLEKLEAMPNKMGEFYAVPVEEMG